jgi:hypothetical protein
MTHGSMTYQFWRNGVVALACVLSAGAADAPAAPKQSAANICTPAGTSRRLPTLLEASGVALSRRAPGVIWSHNDSGEPFLHAFDTTGVSRGRVRIPNAAVVDWEDISVGPCPGRTCLYVADIGDNGRARRSVTIYRVPEPQPSDTESAAPEIFTAVYPDGAHDAEALFVVGDDLFIVTKEAAAAIYRFPKLRAGAAMTLERVAPLAMRRVTDAETSPDGEWVAVRTNDALAFYRSGDLVRGKGQGITVPLRPLKEAQGEGVALDASGMVYLTGEGARGGSFNTLRCTLPK